MNTSNIRLLFGLKLKTLRAERGLSLKELSRKVELSPSYLNEIERGKKHPKPEKIEKLAHALGVSYDDLVSQKLDSSQDHYHSLLNSPALQKIPFHLFGLSLEDIVSLIPDAPNEGKALVRALLDISRSYDMRVEEFFHTALRCYQEMNQNYFDEIEESVAKYRKRNRWKSSSEITYQRLEEALYEDFSVSVDEQLLDETQHLLKLRSVLIDGDSDKLLINKEFSDIQKAFLVAREIGYRELQIKERGRCSPDIEVQSFERIVNAFKASYFASALLIDQRELARELKDFLKLPSWQPQAFLDLIAKFPATAEMFFYRLSEILPQQFGLEGIHFLRFDRRTKQDEIFLIKQLNMSSVRIPTGLALHEHFCRRWLSIKVIERLAQQGALTEESYDVGAQRSHFIESDQEFFCISVARPLSSKNDVLSSVTIGFRVDDHFKKTVKFFEDPAIERDLIGETCERCSLSAEQCGERVAEPLVYLRDQERVEQRNELQQLLERASS